MRSQVEANGVKQVLTKLDESRKTRAVVLTLANLGYRRTSRDKGGIGHAPHLALPTQQSRFPILSCIGIFGGTKRLGAQSLCGRHCDVHSTQLFTLE